MTMAEGVVDESALSVTDGRLFLLIRLPWYRSLPIACLESVHVTVDGAPLALGTVRLPGFAGSIADAADSDAPWDLRDRLEVALECPGQAGQTYDVEASVAVRIPYIQQAPGVPLVQRAT